MPAELVLPGIERCVYRLETSELAFRLGRI
jgi:hypothetical protein